MRQKIRIRHPRVIKAFRSLTLFSIVVFVSGFADCFGEQTVAGYRTEPGHLFLPRVESLEMMGIDGPGAQDIEHAFVRELLRSTSYAIYDGRQGLMAPPPHVNEEGHEATDAAHTAMMFGTVTHNQLSNHILWQEGHYDTLYTREGALDVSVSLRFVDKKTKEVLDSTILTFHGDLPVDEIVQPGAPLSSDDGVEALFAPRDSHRIHQGGYSFLADKLAQELQGRTSKADVKLFVSNQTQRYDASSVAHQMAVKGDWRGAAAQYRRAFTRLENEGMPSPAVAARLLANLAACYSMLGRLDEAVNLYDRALGYEDVRSIAHEKARCEQWLAEAADAEPIVHEK